MAQKLANDKYRAVTRATWIASPADSTIQVTAIPTNVPAYITLGWNTIYETLFEVTGTSGSNSSNYALTGVTKIKGYSGNLPEGLAVNCLNNEEYLNQYSDALGDMQSSIDAIGTLPSGTIVGTTDTQTLTNKRITKRVVGTGSSATPTPNSDTTDVFDLTAQAATAAFAVPSGTPTDAQGLVVRIKDNGTARAISWSSATGGYTGGGATLPSTTVTGKTLHIGFMYVTANSLNKWMCIAIAQQP